MEKEILHNCPVLASYKVYYEWETDLMSFLRLHNIASIIDGTEPRPVYPAATVDTVAAGPVLRSSKKSTTVPGSPVDPDVKPDSSSAAPPNAIAVAAWQKRDQDWQKKNEMAKAAILAKTGSLARNMVKGKEDAAAMWKTLQATFKVINPQMRNNLKMELHNLRLRSGVDPEKHQEAFYRIIDKLDWAGTRLDDEEVCDLFLDSLGDYGRDFRLIWLTKPDVHRNQVTLVNDFMTFMESQKRWKSGGSHDNPIVLGALAKRMHSKPSKLAQRMHNDPPKTQSTSAKKPESQGRSQTQSQPKKADDEDVKCFKCQEYGHYASTCTNPRNNDPKLRALPARRKSEFVYELASPALSGPATLVAMKSTVGQHRYLLDSGASVHIVKDMNLLVDIVPMENPVTLEGIAGSIKVEHVDKLVWMVEPYRLTFSDVQYNPNILFSILSTGRLLDAGWKINMTPEGGTIKRESVIIPLEREMGVHFVNFDAAYCVRPVTRSSTAKRLTSRTNPPLSPKEIAYIGAILESLRVWHERLGHVGVSSLKRMIEAGHLADYKFDPNDSFKTTDCVVCLDTKSMKLPFNKEAYKAKAVLELIHSDTAGPFEPGENGIKYYLTFINDYTKFLKVYFLPDRGKVSTCWPEYVALVERAFDAKVKRLRTDGALEYTGDTGRYNRAHGIVHQVTAPYSPQNNDVAERYNRTIKEMAASMLQGGKIPQMYWAYAVQYASCIINFSGFLERNFNRDNIPKFHELYGRSEHFQFTLRKFGCDAWAKIPSEIRPKADLTAPKTIRGKFLGIVQEGPGAFILDEGQKRIFVSRNVAFPEVDLEATPSVRNDTENDSDDEEIEDSTSNDRNSSEGTGNAHINSSYSIDATNARPIPGGEPDEGTEDGEVGVVALALLAYLEHPTEQDPLTWAEAMKSKFGPDWFAAAMREFKSMEEKKVWKEVIVPEGAKKLGTKWVWKTKRNENREVLKRKGRLVAKGFEQIWGIHYLDTFSPVARLGTMRMLLSIAYRRGLVTRQLDVETAYLNAPLKIPNYIEFPEGYTPRNPEATGLEVTKALYGLTQSAREWWEELNTFLTKDLGFKMSIGDWGLYVKDVDTDHAIFILAYVDDFLLVGQTEDVSTTTKSLMTRWKMTDAGSAKWMLGVRIQRTPTMLALSQQAYIEALSDRYDLESLRSISTPLEHNAKLVPATDADLRADVKGYQSLVGALMWLSLGTRPDITYATNVLSRFNSDPTRHHYHQAMRVLRYLSTTRNLKLTTTSSSQMLVGYVDADWAGDVIDYKSTSGYAFFMQGMAVSWSSAKQDLVAQSSTESEYIALAAATNEATYLSNIVPDFGIKLASPIPILCDNQSAITLTGNPAFHKRSKHFGIRYHVTRNKIQDGTIRLTYCPTGDQVADIFTKSLPRHLHERHVKGLGLR